ncbi:MAG: nucleotidyltransferase [Planctomycetes bacterium]|nr:nucleotidyltransferase [Planctomycetota bacterium]
MTAENANAKSALIVLAAGMGSRYGGLKQIDPVGPNKESIIDYSIYDAMKAGFQKVVFVIRSDFKDAFEEKITSKFNQRIETIYVFQQLRDSLGDFQLPAERKKPWGTAHAVLVAKDVVNEPFAVINADDYYGPNAFKTLKNYFDTSTSEKNDYSMVGYVLQNTLSDFGTVSRGVCQCDDQMLLAKVVERTNIQKLQGQIKYLDDDSNEHELTGNEIVSMNFWGFKPSIFSHLQSQFKEFLNNFGNDLDSEFFIPTVINNLIENQKASVKVLKTNDNWFGITYQPDKEIVINKINHLIEEGVYPAKLWQ